MPSTQKQREAYRRWYENNKDSARKKKREAMRRCRAANPQKYAAQSRASQRRLKAAVFDIYGRRCASCGFSDIRALTLDHKKNNGAQERKALGERGVYRRALENIPEDYQTLCMNCQFIKRVEAGRQNQHGKCSQKD